MTDKIVVLVTCGSAKEARKIARAVVDQRIAACANIVTTPVQSVYRWKGRVESAKEFLLIHAVLECFAPVDEDDRDFVGIKAADFRV